MIASPSDAAPPRSTSWRQRLVQDLEGHVLEIGVGTGENLAHYRRAGQVSAIEPDPERADKARAAARSAHVPVKIDVAPAEQLPYADAIFDHVVSSLVFCSVSDQRAALAEIRRVLKPNGALHMVEHVRPDSTLLGWLFSAATPYWRQIANNCHLDRRTLDVLAEEGWQVQVHKRRWMFVHLTARPFN
jgi:ubiquinone/menaquinone biosynthesis C-methylase UbiE